MEIYSRVLDTHLLVGLRVEMPRFLGPEVHQSLCVQDGMLSLFRDRFGDMFVVEVESGESESAVDAVDDDLGTELVVVVDVGLGGAEGENLVHILPYEIGEVVLLHIVLDVVL